MRSLFYTVISLLALLLIPVSASTAQTADKPFIFPVAGTPGPSNWLFGQAYGNTTGAYNFGEFWYSAGQGLHFGIDIAMPCGTQLVAVADGEVMFVDNLSFGSGPHNLLIRHDNGIVSLYGHLLQPATFIPGQRVTQGQIIALSGDPDITCESRPHLHYEARSSNYGTTYNPVDYIDVNWHMLASAGAFGYPLFQQDLFNAGRWMTLEDQPDVVFGGRILNNYDFVWPLDSGEAPPPNPQLDRDLGPLPEETNWSLRQIGSNGCCINVWWHPTDPDQLQVINGAPGQRAQVEAWSANTGTATEILQSAPPVPTSPDGSLNVFSAPSYVTINRPVDGVEWVVYTGAPPAISPDNRQLVWVTSGGPRVPGQPAPPASIWLSDINGDNARIIISDAGFGVQWLDMDRLLIRQSFTGRITALTVYDTSDSSVYSLGNFRNLRGLSVAPGGNRLMYMLTWQSDPATDGVYVLDVAEGAVPQQLPWFGGWRWRDRDSVYYLPLDANNRFHSLAYYHIPSGENRILTTPETLPFTIKNGDWDVSVDGKRIVFHEAADNEMWLLEMD